MKVAPLLTTAITLACAALGVSSAAAAAVDTVQAEQVTLVPLDGFPPAQARELARWLERRLPVRVRVSPSRRLPTALIAPARKQLVAEEAIEWLGAGVNGPEAVIGITRRDMYPRSEGWRFAFGHRQLARRLGLISSWRMDPKQLGGVPDRGLFERRLQKYVLRYTLLLAQGRALVGNPRSVLADSVTSVEDLDSMEAAVEPRARGADYQSWAIAANGACTDYAAEARRLAARAGQTPLGLVALFDRLNEATETFISRFDDLPAERADRARIAGVTALLRRQLAFEREAAAELRQRFSEERLAAVVRQDGRFNATLQSLFVELGLSRCAST